MTRDLLPAIIIATICIVVFALVLPKWDEVSATRAAQADLDQLIKERADYRANVVKLQDRIKNNQVDVTKLNLLLPERQQLDQVIVNLQTAAQQNGFQLKELTMGADQPAAAGPRKIAIKLNGSATYPSFFNYLQAMEQSLRLYDIGEINIGHEANTAGNFGIEFKLNTYNLK